MKAEANSTVREREMERLRKKSMMAYILYIHFFNTSMLIHTYIHTYIQEEEGGGRYRNRSQDRCREIGPRAERKERGCQSREGRGANTYIHTYIHAYIYAYIHTQYLVYPDIIHTCQLS